MQNHTRWKEPVERTLRRGAQWKGPCEKNCVETKNKKLKKADLCLCTLYTHMYCTLTYFVDSIHKVFYSRKTLEGKESQILDEGYIKLRKGSK